MRTGVNPYKSLQIEKKLNGITLGVLVNIPNVEGYYKNAMRVMEDCLRSAKDNTALEFDLLVADNNSTGEVKELLYRFQDEGLIRILIQNRTNIGRTNGVRQILSSSPGDYVGYSDCDIYFKKGWLEKEIELLREIPNAGFVSGMPNRSFTNYFTDFTKKYVTEDNGFNVEQGKLIPDETIRSFAESLGYEDISEPISIWDKNEDIRINYNGLIAYVGASHMQFMVKKELVNKLPVVRFEKLTGCNEEIVDKYVDTYGYLRLSTSEPVIHHMGNIPITSNQTAKKVSKGNSRSLYRKVIGRIYDWSFKKYYETD